MHHKKFFLAIIACVLLLASCSTKESPSEGTAAYPPPEKATGYPLREDSEEDEIENSYPAYTEVDPDYPQGPEFTINEPVKGGDIIVTGTGPAGVPIILVNVSEVGLELGETIIAEDGTYIFNLESPLETGHSIGIKLGDLTGTDFNENDFIYSDSYFVRPLIGILFDLVSVE